MHRCDAGCEGKRRAVGLAVLMLALAGLAAGQDAQKAGLKVSEKPLAAEQLAVYRAALGGWMAQEMPALNLAIQTVPLNWTLNRLRPTSSTASGSRTCRSWGRAEP